MKKRKRITLRHIFFRFETCNARILKAHIACVYYLISCSSLVPIRWSNVFVSKPYRKECLHQNIHGNEKNINIQVPYTSVSKNKNAVILMLFILSVILWFPFLFPSCSLNAPVMLPSCSLYLFVNPFFFKYIYIYFNIFKYI